MENKRNLEKANLPKLSWSQKLGDKNSFRLNALPKGSGGTTGAGSNNFNNGGGRPDADNGKSHGAFASVIVKKGHDYPDLIGVEIFAWADMEMAAKAKNLQKTYPKQYKEMIHRFRQKGGNDKVVCGGLSGIYVRENPEHTGKIYRFDVDWKECMIDWAQAGKPTKIPPLPLTIQINYRFVNHTGTAYINLWEERTKALALGKGQFIYDVSTGQLTKWEI